MVASATRVSRWVMTALVVTLLVSLEATAEVSVGTEGEVVSLGARIDLLQDRERSLGIAQAAAPEYAGLYEPSSGDVLRFGFSESAWWIRFTVANRAAKAITRFLEIDQPLLEQVDFFLPRPGGGFERTCAGRRTPLEERGVRHRNYLARIALAPGETIQGYIRVAHSGAEPFALRLWAPDALKERDATFLWRSGLFYGALGTMAIYNLFLFLSLREPTYFYYVLLLLAQAFAAPAFDGTAAYVTAFLHPGLAPPDELPLVNAFMILGLQFFRSFMMTRRYVPRLDRTIVLLMGALALDAALPLIGFRPLALQISAVLVVLSGVMFVVANAVVWKAGYRAARLLILVPLLSGGAVALVALQVLGIMPALFTNLYDVFRITGAAVSLILAFALADRFHLMREEKEKAQRDALEATERANATLADSARSLEGKVAERTAALEERTRELGQRNEELQRSERELALARDRALAANLAKSTFLARMSHELRTPLTAIIGYGEMLQEDTAAAGHEIYGPDLDKIVRSARHLLGLINDILDVSKVEAGKVDLFAERVEVGELVRFVAETVRPLVERNENQLVLPALEGLGTMHSDLTRLRQILVNLLSNAAKFTKRGTIRLAVEREGRDESGWVTFTVADTGIGMSEEQVERIFEAFVQAEASTGREYGGSGLGLTITKRFCEMMGGTIEVRSEPGRGSEFRVRLPADISGAGATAERRPSVGAPVAEIEGAAAAIPAVAIDSPVGASVMGTGARSARPVRARVLVIEDDAATRELLERTLEREGYVVASAVDGQHGLRLAREWHPDLITLDVKMPHADGWSVLSTIKADAGLADIPVIVVTMVEDHNLGYALGASEYLVKPVDRERLAQLVGRYTSRGRAEPVLVVEDDPEMREVLRRTIERAGLEVLEADNGSVALQRMTERAPQLVLLDLMMPEMDGLEFLTAMRARDDWRGIPVVVVTAKDLSAEERAHLSGLTQRVLEKRAWSRATLLEEIRRLVEARAANKTGEGTAIPPAARVRERT